MNGSNHRIKLNITLPSVTLHKQTSAWSNRIVSSIFSHCLISIQTIKSAKWTKLFWYRDGRSFACYFTSFPTAGEQTLASAEFKPYENCITKFSFHSVERCFHILLEQWAVLRYFPFKTLCVQDHLCIIHLLLLQEKILHRLCGSDQV